MPSSPNAHTRKRGAVECRLERVGLWKKSLKTKALDDFKSVRRAVWKRSSWYVGVLASALAKAERQGLGVWPCHFTFGNGSDGNDFTLLCPLHVENASKKNRKSVPFLLSWLQFLREEGRMDVLALLSLALTTSQKVTTHWSEGEDDEAGSGREDAFSDAELTDEEEEEESDDDDG